MSKIATGTVLEFLTDGTQQGLDAKPILCPVCQFSYNHQRGIKLVESDDYKAWTGRGDCLVIRMECEESHEWEMCVGYHKGEQYIFARAGWTKTAKPDYAVPQED